jgi:prepilin-type N-terminal cleavage/methylation domain-containing protein
MQTIRARSGSKGERGFTLIELMIVVAIIAILAGILIPNFVNARAQAQTSACESNLRGIATALELLYADNQNYGAGGAVPAATRINNVDYLSNSPRDPADPTGAGTYQVVLTNGGQGYTVTCPGTHTASTLTKLTTDGTTTQCGAGCAAKTIIYTSGIGLTVR